MRTIDNLFDEATELYRSGHYKNALEYYSRVLEANQNNEAALCNKGLTLTRLNRLEEALEYFDRALKTDLDNREILFSKKVLCGKGCVLYKLNRLEEALRCYDRALEIDPNYKVVWYNKGAALKRLNRLEEAIKCYDRILEIDPNYKKVKYSRAFLKIKNFFRKYLKIPHKKEHIKELDILYESLLKKHKISTITARTADNTLSLRISVTPPEYNYKKDYYGPMIIHTPIRKSAYNLTMQVNGINSIISKVERKKKRYFRNNFDYRETDTGFILNLNNNDLNILIQRTDNIFNILEKTIKDRLYLTKY